MRVLEISGSSAAANAGLLVAQIDFQVDRLAVDELTNRFTEAQRVFFQRGKHEIERDELDLDDYDAVVEDVGIEMLAKHDLSIEEIRSGRESLVVVSLSDLGLIGPYAGWASSEITVQAVGGVLHVSGYGDEPPLKLPGNTAAMILGVHGATAVTTAVFGVTNGAESGIHIDISAQDTLMQHWTRHISQYAYAGTTTERAPRNPEGIHFRHTAKAKDGWVYMLALRAAWQKVADFLGLSEQVALEKDPNVQPWREMEAAFVESIASKDKYTWFSEAAEQGWTFAPVEDPFDIVSNPQNQARDFFEETDYQGRMIRVPGLPYRIER